jgi:hypothetical protein
MQGTDRDCIKCVKAGSKMRSTKYEKTSGDKK